jgi:thiopurine S-methyltransferase
MQQGFWADRWRAGQIGFHLPEVNRRLIAHADRLPPPPARVLVPLCGKSHDLGWLADRGHPVVGVEFVEQAVRAFFEERGVAPQVGQLGGQLALSSGAITLLAGDFFAADAAVLGRFPAVWDRAALVAVAPEQQRAYLAHLRSLVADDGRVLLVSFDHDLPSGPPFPISGPALAQLCDGLFTQELLEDADIFEQEPKFKERGATRIRELTFLLRPI